MIPNGWSQSVLSDGIELISGRHIEASGCNTIGVGMPYLTGPEDFPNGCIQTTKFVHRPDVVCSPGDVLLVVKGSGTGKMIRADDRYCISRQLMAMRSSIWSTSFLEHFIRASEERFNSAASGLIPGITRIEILKTPLMVPPLPEQRKIARILTTVDSLIEKTESLIAKYQAIKQGMIHDLFTRGVDAHGHLRPPQTEAPDLYKQSELGWIPKEWDVGRVGDYLDRIEQGWSPDCDSEPSSAGEWGVLKTTAVVWDGFNCRENKRLPPRLTPLPQFEVHTNDVLMTRGGPNSRVGVVSIVKETRDKLMLSDKIYRLVPKSKVSPSYLALALSSERTQTHLSALKTGLAESQTNISQAIVRRLWIGIPDPEEQRITCERIEAIDMVLHTQRRSLSEFRVQKTGLMQDLLLGKVRVKSDETDEANTIQ